MIEKGREAGTGAEPTTWVVLRTSPGRTLGLARYLRRDGVRVWTPSHTVQVRRPRSKMKAQREIATMPTFVFARADHLEQLDRMSRAEDSLCPPFSVLRLRHNGREARVRDSELRRMKVASLPNAERPVCPSFALGDAVRVPEGPFGGMSGVVEGKCGKLYLVALAGGKPVKFGASLIELEQI